MSYANVTSPISITISQASVAKIDNYLRRMCIVSAGDTELEAGEYKEVYASDYAEILKATDNETANKLKGYFAFASSKPIIVLEVGSDSIESQVANLSNFINAGKQKSYMHLVPNAWYYPDESYMVIDETKPALKLSPTSLTLPKGQSFTLSPLYSGEITYTAGENLATNFTWDESSHTISGNADGTAGQKATLTIKVTQGTETITQEISLTLGEADSEIVESGDTLQNYKLGRDTSFASLAEQYIDNDSNTYFIIKSNGGLADSESWALYNGKKCVFVVYDNLTTSYPLSSVALGVMASSQYDLSANQKSTPLNNKSINGVSYNELGQVLMNNLTQQPQNFAGDFAGTTVLFNGRYASGDTWEYLYQSDFVIYQVLSAISTLLLNSSNNANYALQFNQVGIDVLNATVKGALDTCVNLNVLTDYGTNFNATTNLIENSGYVYTMDFSDYKAAYLENYNNEIYSGLSFAMQVGRYIKQVNIAISRG